MVLNWRLLSKISFIEGASLLLLLFVAMPLKYLVGVPLAVKIVGMLHGLLFMVLVTFISLIGTRDKWPRFLTIVALISSSVPFGMFYLERKLKTYYDKSGGDHQPIN